MSSAALIPLLVPYRDAPNPLPDFLPDSDGSENYIPRAERGLTCPLHKLIRDAAKSARDNPTKTPDASTMSEIVKHLRSKPNDVLSLNGVGWTPLHLALYHRLSYSLIDLLLTSLPPSLRPILCSTRTLKCSRLPLHFASRFIDDIRIYELLQSLHPSGVLEKCSNEVTPVERAKVNKKDLRIISFLSNEEKKQMVIWRRKRRNLDLKYEAISCMDRKWEEEGSETKDFRVFVYGYCKEREIGLFRDIISYIGVVEDKGE
ncbi:hypothetical protein TrVE_jg510 [Triparma verrucosa]|uniref:Ankyrin n=1 Tax=Triparma verrucosa TaxID=1606542 RepID=A0A9W7BTZ3_9STRA|nr:hypothetical protein TrVE_jg510 [Triparma verrucosa]